VRAAPNVRERNANGVLVNGARIDGSRVLATSDLIRIGSEEFRFHAAAQLAETRHTPAIRDAIPAAVRVAEEKREPLAVLQVTNNGPTNGQEYAVRVPLAHIGRGAHNDVAINDESVSDSHAKLQCRDGNWFITDLDSTNGTYVAGERLKGERMLHGVVDLRFGGVKMAFRPAAAPVESLKGTRAIASIDRSKLRPTTSVAAQDAATTPSALPQQGISAWVWGVVVLALVAAAAFFLLNR
jgi:pSer/pThr/pTyr-binding forkhead associated (FHA) protein